MPKDSDLSPKQAHDVARQNRAHLVRLDEEEQRGAEILAKRRKMDSVAALLRSLLRSEIGLGTKVRK